MSCKYCNGTIPHRHSRCANCGAPRSTAPIQVVNVASTDDFAEAISSGEADRKILDILGRRRRQLKDILR